MTTAKSVLASLMNAGQWLKGLSKLTSDAPPPPDQKSSRLCRTKGHARSLARHPGNPKRRACKPLYGGMAHQMRPIGWISAPSIDKVRKFEIMYRRKIWVKEGKMYFRNTNTPVPLEMPI